MKHCTIRIAKRKALISFAVTAKLICAFVFGYAKCWFSHDAAHYDIVCGSTKTISQIFAKHTFRIAYRKTNSTLDERQILTGKEQTLALNVHVVFILKKKSDPELGKLLF